MVTVFRAQDFCSFIDMWVDTDHAGCARTRRSTNGGALRYGEHTLKTWSTTQAVVALSSGEAEYYGIVKGAKEGLGLQSMLLDWGLSLPLELSSDSSAARGHVQRRGLGKMRHIQTRYLWVQERVGEGHLKITSVPGKHNCADILTKCVGGSLLVKHMTTAGFRYCQKHVSQRSAL